MTPDAALSPVAPLLLALASLFPLALLALTVAFPGVRPRLATLLWLAPLPGLAAAVFAQGAAVSLPTPLALGLMLDRPGALLLGSAALIWCAAGIAAPAWWGEKLRNLPYQAWWLATLAGSMTVFIAADLVTFYLAFSLVSLAGYGLVTRDGTPAAQKAGRVYFALAVMGEAFLLSGLVLLSIGAGGETRIAAIVAALPSAPLMAPALVLVLLGLAAKLGLVPLHLWMPPSYGAAPYPAAAVLSGAAVKAGVIGLVRFLPYETPLETLGFALAAGGFFSAFFGVAIGLTQRHPKHVLAYSSISQMGVIAAVAGLSLAAGRAVAPTEIAYYGLHHVFAKGGLFLALAALSMTGTRGRAALLWPAAIVALGIAGLPLTGGALAKLAIKDALGSGWPKTLGSLSAVASTVLMLHFLTLATVVRSRDASAVAPVAIRVAWWAAALASLGLPWLLFPSVRGSLASALAPSSLVELGWPIIAGVALFALLRLWPNRPSLPPGDILAVIRRGEPWLARLSNGVAAIEGFLTDWTVAGAVLLLLALALAGAML